MEIRRKRSRVMWATAAVVLLATVVTAQDAPPKPHVVSNTEGTVSLTLPVGWSGVVVERPQCALAVDLTALKEHTLRVDVSVPRDVRDPIALALGDRRAIAEQYGVDVEQISVSREPVPHMVVEYERDGWPKVAFYGYTRIGRQAFRLSGSQLSSESWELLASDVMGLVGALDSTLSHALPCPDGYTEVGRDGATFHVHPEVSEEGLERLAARLLAQRAIFERGFGPITSAAGNEPIVVVHPDRGAARAISQSAAAARFGMLHEPTSQRLFVVPTEDDHLDAHDELAAQTERWLQWERFGGTLPDWLAVGCADLARAYVWTEQVGPVLPPTFSTRPSSFPTLGTDGVAAETGRFWVLFFRHGPRKYQSAFRACLEVAGRTHDWDTAAREHLLTLDQYRMTKDLEKFAERRIRVMRR